jgi:hypothetical protein
MPDWGIDCAGCGGAVTARGRGKRRALYFSIRDRGTKWKNYGWGVIHRGCIPTAGQPLQLGIPARSRRASQVRA